MEITDLEKLMKKTLMALEYRSSADMPPMTGSPDVCANAYRLQAALIQCIDDIRKYPA